MFSEQILFVPVFQIRIRKEMLRIRTLVSTIVKQKLPFSTAIKGIVQRIVRGVETRLKKSVWINWRHGRFPFLILKGHHHERSILSFSAA
jgi:hypothetical protein